MNADKLYALAVSALSRRDHTQKQMELFLHSHSQDADLVSELMLRLNENGYLNDNRVLDNELRKYIDKCYGKRRIRQELRQKKFSSDSIESAIEKIDVDWHTLAKELKVKKFGTLNSNDDKAKAKQIRYLQYRGHEMSDIMALVNL